MKTLGFREFAYREALTKRGVASPYLLCVYLAWFNRTPQWMINAIRRAKR